MELDEFYVDVSRLEEEFGLPPDTFAEWKLEDSNQEESAFGHVSEGTSVFLKDDYDPLKESNNQSFSFDADNESLQNDWFDERADIGAMLNDFIKSGSFDDVLNVMEESEVFTKSCEIEVGEPTEISKNSDELWDENISKTEVMSDSNVEIEDDEINLQKTSIIYVEDIKSCEGLTPINDQIHNLAVSEYHGADVLSSSSTININDELMPFDILGTQATEVTSIELPKEDATSMEIPSTSDFCNLKSRRGRKKSRVEPYKNLLEETNSSISSGISSPSSFPGSPSSEFSCELDDQLQPTTKRKERKKHQNRNAATKYRQKKRAELDKICSEEQELEHKNKELKQKVESLSTEIDYLKGLMREILTARGILKT